MLRAINNAVNIFKDIDPANVQEYSLRKTLRALITAGGEEIYACKPAMDMFKLTKDDLSEQVKDVLTVGEFYALAGGEDSQIIFT